MAISHAIPGQPIDVRPLGEQLPNARTAALFKSDELEVIRIVLLAGKSMPPHQVPGEITVQCLEGTVELSAEGVVRTLHAGQLLYLSGGVQHSVRSIGDASLLVTIVLHGTKPRAALV